MAELLSERQNRALRRRVFRHVRGLLIDVYGVQENPHGVGWVREPTMGKRVPGEEVAEFVMHLRYWHRYQPQQAHSDQDRCRRDPNQHQRLVPRHPFPDLLDPLEEAVAK